MAAKSVQRLLGETFSPLHSQTRWEKPGRVGCLKNEDRRPLENEDLENEDPLEKEDLNNGDPKKTKTSSKTKTSKKRRHES